MLTTSNRDQYAALPVRLKPGVTAWSAVHLVLQVPYVFVTWASKEGRAWISQSVIYWRPEDVLHCCRDFKGDKSRKILDLSVLLPVSSKNNYGWRWVPIKEVWATPLNEDFLANPMYVTFDGERIGGFGELGSSSTSRDARRVYVSTKRSPATSS